MAKDHNKNISKLIENLLQEIGEDPTRQGLLKTPEDVAQAALFLASDMSDYMTGTYLVVDGGLTSTIDMPEWLWSRMSS